SKSAGPGTVTFGNVNALSTTASFSTSGSYVLRLTGTNAYGTSTSDVTISVNPVVVTTTASTVRIITGSTTSYTDTKGNVWAADAYYTDAPAGALPAGGMVDYGPIAIANTTDPRIFQTEHYCMSSYNIPLTNATYTVNLYFAESYFTGPGQNVFD